MRKYLVLLLILVLVVTGTSVQAAEPEAEDDVFTFYQINKGGFLTISFAPAGTEDWRRVESVAGCHDWLYSSCGREVGQYQFPYSGEECTLWDIKLETLPDEEPVKSLFPDAEYSCIIWRNMTLKDGENALRYYSAYNSTMVIVEPMIFCEDCYEVFGLEPEQEVE